MKKIIILITMLFIITGCKNKDLSNNIYETCKESIKITDKFINYEYNEEKAVEELQNILKDCNNNATTNSDKTTCSKLLDTLSSLQNYNTGNSSDRDNITSKRKEISEYCGL